MRFAKKYGIRSISKLQIWIKKYNDHEEFEASGTGGNSLMTKGRKTTFEERVEIASYCISHDHNYAEASEKFKVSYQQARNYTIKYEKGGVTTLQDNRGRRKAEDSFTEVEKLQAELKLQKAKLQRAEMELSFLKNSKNIIIQLLPFANSAGFPELLITNGCIEKFLKVNKRTDLLLTR